MKGVFEESLQIGINFHYDLCESICHLGALTWKCTGSVIMYLGLNKDSILWC